MHVSFQFHPTLTFFGSFFPLSTYTPHANTIQHPNPFNSNTCCGVTVTIGAGIFTLLQFLYPENAFLDQFWISVFVQQSPENSSIKVRNNFYQSINHIL